MKSSEKNNVLQIQNFSIGYTNKKATTTIASGLDFSVQRGTFTCLLGKNGIGKSTLLRSITKVQKPLSGNILLHKKELESYKNSDLSKNISVVLTEKLPDSNLTVFELIALGRQPYTNWIGTFNKKDESIIQKAIELTNIEHLKNKKYFELSDGQFQRVLIARALAQDTEIIILDEPTAHLDIHHTLETFELLKDLACKENKTIIVSTHQIQLALQTAHELFLMTEDEFIIGSPQSLIDSKKIEKLFKNEAVSFDYSKEQFRLNT